jgi:hypothetical protein
LVKGRELCPSLLVTTTFNAPTACAGVVAVIDVALTTTTPVAGVPPRLTVALGRKPVPVMVTGVPPVVGPLVGKIVLTVGAGLTAV